MSKDTLWNGIVYASENTAVKLALMHALPNRSVWNIAPYGEANFTTTAQVQLMGQRQLRIKEDRERCRTQRWNLQGLYSTDQGAERCRNVLPLPCTCLLNME